MTIQPVRIPAEPKSSNDLAKIRTAMATDRTLMAWVRTALSMFSFGFTIYKVLQGFEESGHVRGHTPRDAGLLLIGMGLLSMVMGTFEYCATQREMNLKVSLSLRRPTLILATIMTLGGIALFGSIIDRLV